MSSSANWTSSRIPVKDSSLMHRPSNSPPLAHPRHLGQILPRLHGQCMVDQMGMQDRGADEEATELQRIARG
eukprot:7757204-Prorocentrum_lima.AAC.1